MNLFPQQFGPSPRDELATESTALLADGTLPAAPPFTAPSPAGRTMNVDGQDVFVRVSGRQEADETWFVHGLEGSSRNWDRLAAVLAEHSTACAPDLPGSGLSAPPIDGTYSIPAEAHLIARLIEQRGRGPVHLVGNSRGGFVSTLLAAQRPDLVRTLTLISPAVRDFRIVGERGADARLGLVMLPGIAHAVTKRLDLVPAKARAQALALTCFGEPGALTADDLDAAAADYGARQSLPWASLSTVKSLRSLIRAQARPGRGSFAAAARAVTAPTLVVWGTRDRLVDCRLAAPTARQFRESRLLVLPRTGHVAQMERPEEVARAMLALWSDASARSEHAGAPCVPAGEVVGT